MWMCPECGGNGWHYQGCSQLGGEITVSVGEISWTEERGLLEYEAREGLREIKEALKLIHEDLRDIHRVLKQMKGDW